MNIQYKLKYGKYDPKTKVSKVVITHKYGTFEAIAKVAKEDEGHESRYFGCEIAEIKAAIKLYQTILRDINSKINILRSLQDQAFDICLRNGYNVEDEVYGVTGRQIFYLLCNLKQDKQDIQNKIKDLKEKKKKMIESRQTFKELVTELNNMDKGKLTARSENDRNLKTKTSPWIF